MRLAPLAPPVRPDRLERLENLLHQQTDKRREISAVPTRKTEVWVRNVLYMNQISLEVTAVKTANTGFRGLFAFLARGGCVCVKP